VSARHDAHAGLAGTCCLCFCILPDTLLVAVVLLLYSHVLTQLYNFIYVGRKNKKIKRYARCRGRNALRHGPLLLAAALALAGCASDHIKCSS
jgi:hypothetical protein